MIARSTQQRGPVALSLFAIVVAAGLLRAIGLGTEPLWGDEGLSVLVAHYKPFDLLFRPVDPTPGLYFLLQKLSLPFGTSSTITRLPSLVCGLMLPVAGFLAVRPSGTWRALAAAALLGAAAPLVEYSREARAYALLLLLLVAGAGALLRAFEERTAIRWKLLLISAGLGLAAIYTHVAAWLVVAPLALLALRWAEKGSDRRRIAGWALLFLVAALPEVHRFLLFMRTPVNDFQWLRQPGGEAVMRLLTDLVYPRAIETSAQQWSPFPAKWVRRALLLAAAVWLAWRTYRLPPPTTDDAAFRRHLAQVGVVFIATPLWLWLAGEVAAPLLMPRTALPMVVGLVLAIAAVARSALVPALVAIVWAINACWSTPAWRKEPWAEVSQQLATPGHAVTVMCPAWRFPAFVLAGPRQRSDTLVVLTDRGPILAGRPGDDAATILGRFDRLYWRPHLPVAAPTSLRREILRLSSWRMVGSECVPEMLRSLPPAKRVSATVLERGRNAAPVGVSTEVAKGAVLFVTADPH